ncbi:hypothetical protein [Methylobacterium durans]|uniref:hypothetical protein n=1 Tax=Methylobacterium durans TaxID=2202825 RepID=UPI0018825E04|nr:hypothetical protein [Methylobacterium durans]
MQIFQIRQSASGAILWTGAAHDEAEAFEAMAHAAGFIDFAHLPEKIRDSGLSAERISP